MRYNEINTAWRALATACLRDAVKTADLDCSKNYIFSTLCGLALKDEGDVIGELKFAEEMKMIYGAKWYRKIEIK
jgi:hypothetical protein